VHDLPRVRAAVALGLTACLFAAQPAGFAAAEEPASRAALTEIGKPKPPAAKPLTFGVQASSRTKPDTRPHFAYTAVPGGQIVDYLAISNYSDAPVSLRVYAGDAFTNADGGFDLTPSQQQPRDLGKWVSVGNPRVTLAARTRAILPFRLAVPANASPGDHTGGIIASLSTTSRGKSGDVVTVEHRLAERIYLRVPGALRPSLIVQRLSASYRGTTNPAGRGEAVLSYRITNDGNLRLGASVTADASNVFGSRAAGTAQSIPELLPGSSITLTSTAAGVIPALRGIAHVRVTPVRLGAASDPSASPAEGAKGFWTIPVSLLVIIVMLVVTAVVLRRRAARHPGGAHSARRRHQATAQVPAQPVRVS
jgi:hypothetical protein